MTAAKRQAAETPFRRVSSVEVRQLPIGPEEAFVLSRVDGKSDGAAIAGATGLSETSVARHLRRLSDLGAIEPAPDGGSPRAQSHAGDRVREPDAAPAESAPARRDLKASMTRERAAALAGRFAGELDETLDLTLGHQATIIDLSSRLDDLDHFEVLGVSRSAERVEIKRAYFSAVGAFHPDKYFGKNLGSLRRRMEKVFQRMTEAHDVLSHRQARADYETYLAALERTRPKSPSAVPNTLEDLERLLSQAERDATETRPAASPEARLPNAAPQMPPPLPPRANAAGSRVMNPPPFPRNVPIQPPVEVPDDPAARRQALARKLGLAPPKPVTEEQRDQEQRTKSLRQRAVAKELRDRYQHRKATISDQRISRYVKAAEDALAAGNPVSALNTIKIAESLETSLEVSRQLTELETQASALLADSYLERARYEESNGHYDEAARSYARSARGRPSSDVLRSAAECYLKAGTELRKASELAREAVQIAPKRADLRLTLAKVYEAAGMQQSAAKELARALELAPENDRIKQWLKRLERGGV